MLPAETLGTQRRRHSSSAADTDEMLMYGQLHFVETQGANTPFQGGGEGIYTAILPLSPITKYKDHRLVTTCYISPWIDGNVVAHPEFSSR
jgi:hypothetical protein